MDESEKLARDAAAELELGDHCWPYMRGWDAALVYRDASQAKASAEFPDADAKQAALEHKHALNKSNLSFVEGARWGFEKGRETCAEDLERLGSFRKAYGQRNAKIQELEAKLRDSVTNDWVRTNTVSVAVHEDLQTKLHEANAEIERLKSQINTHK